MTPRSLIGSGYNPSLTCGACRMPYATTADRCPCCGCPEWLSKIHHLTVRWMARSRFSAACVLGGAE